MLHAVSVARPYGTEGSREHFLCLTQARPRFVTVTFPTGKVTRFKAVTAPDCEMFDSAAPMLTLVARRW
jgi:hypothetical protein